MATFQGGNPIPRHVDDALKREDHANPVTNLPKDEQNPKDGRGGEVDEDPSGTPASPPDEAEGTTGRQPRGDEPVKP
jgi:hypothetical protein